MHSNDPESDVKTHREFHMKLVDQLVQLLLDLWASTDCPKHLYDSKGRPTKGNHVRLLGKHFAYKGTKSGICSVCYSGISPTTNKKTKKNTKLLCDVYLCEGVCFETYHTCIICLHALLLLKLENKTNCQYSFDYYIFVECSKLMFLVRLLQHHFDGN